MQARSTFVKSEAMLGIVETEEKSQRDRLKIFRHDILQRGLTASMTFKGAAYIIAAVLVPTLGS